MILGAFIQVNLATKIERKNVSSTKKTYAAAISFNYQRQQQEKTLFFLPSWCDELFKHKEFVLFY